ncbi:glutamine synthetase 1, mitochondrial [Bombyx mori]|uniref:glutamine synthetase n=1 Tax=Bombyx mori TaxID=7091 RepID=A0A8R2APZ0_BOMMO|nr:glutamine synthetase 1, mitochondrial [Bombyx mori]
MYCFKTCAKVFRSIFLSKNLVYKNMKHVYYLSTSSIFGHPGSHDAYYNYFLNLPFPKNKIFATYVWIDASGINLRSKDRILDKEPCDLEMVPKWSYDGSSTGQSDLKDSDITLLPVAVYRDPFRKSPHIIVLCETYSSEGLPTPTNHRVSSAITLSKICDQEPWFGIEQEYTMFDRDHWPLGWPKPRGYPDQDSKNSYCGVGEHVAGREIAECHARACIYSGMDYDGSNAEVMNGSWEFQVGPTLGIKAADDIWIGRYLLNRIAEHFDVIISFHPKPMGDGHAGIGCHHNFSTKKMRADQGVTEIKRICKILCDQHEKIIKSYDLKDGEDNKKRLVGKFETSSYDSCRVGISDRSASIRIQKKVISEGKGYFEDRRPAGNCDPYMVCGVIAKTCI